MLVTGIFEKASFFFFRVVKNRDCVVKFNPLTTLKKKLFENTMGKGENAGNQHFLLFPTMFFVLLKTNFNFSVTVILSSASAFNFGPV